MPNDISIRHLKLLIAARKAALQVDDGWAGYDCAQSDAALWNLETVQLDLLKIDFVQAEAKALGFALLIDGDDDPNFADDFKNRLFQVLRAASA